MVGGRPHREARDGAAAAIFGALFHALTDAGMKANALTMAALRRIDPRLRKIRIVGQVKQGIEK